MVSSTNATFTSLRYYSALGYYYDLATSKGLGGASTIGWTIKDRCAKASYSINSGVWLLSQLPCAISPRVEKLNNAIAPNLAVIQPRAVITEVREIIETYGSAQPDVMLSSLESRCKSSRFSTREADLLKEFAIGWDISCEFNPVFVLPCGKDEFSSICDQLVTFTGQLI